MKSLFVSFVFVLSQSAMASSEPAAHCEGMMKNEYKVFLIDATSTASSSGILAIRDSEKDAENFQCTKGDNSKVIWNCLKTPAQPGTMKITIIPTPHGDFAELFTGDRADQLDFVGTLDCRY